MTGQSRKVTKERQQGLINIHEISHHHVTTTADWTANVISIAAFQSILCVCVYICIYKLLIFDIFLVLHTNVLSWVRALRWSLSPPPIFPDSLALTPHTCHSSHSQLFPIITVYHSLPPLCLVALYVYVLVFVVCTPGINALCCRLYVSRFLYTSLIPVLFFALLAFFVSLIKCFTCSWTQTSVYTVISLTAPWHLQMHIFE